MKRLKLTFFFVCMIFGVMESKGQKSKTPLNFNNGEIAKKNLEKYVSALENVKVFYKIWDKKTMECENQNDGRSLGTKLQMAYWSDTLTSYKQNCYKPYEIVPSVKN